MDRNASQTVQRPVDLDELINLRVAAAKLGRPYHTLWRWATDGVFDVRLQTVCSGRFLQTTRRWIAEFQEACGQARRQRLTSARTTKGRPPVERAAVILQSHEVAVAELKKAGLLS